MRLMARVVIGFRRPRRPILGAVLAGEIEAIGRKVSRFQVGDRVWAFTVLRMGCYAQRTCVPATLKLLTPAPSNLSDDETAAIPGGGLMSLYFLKANIQSGQQVLVYGASGANGTCAVQLAKHLGAEVTAVCSTGTWSCCGPSALTRSSTTRKNKRRRLGATTSCSMPWDAKKPRR